MLYYETEFNCSETVFVDPNSKSISTFTFSSNNSKAVNIIYIKLLSSWSVHNDTGQKLCSAQWSRMNVLEGADLSSRLSVRSAKFMLS